MNDQLEHRFSDDIESFFSSGTVILFTCDSTADFPILSVSKNVEQILGYSTSYFLDNKDGWSSRIHPEDKEEVFANFKKLVSNGGSAINEYRFKAKDGSWVWLRDEIKLIKNDKWDKDVIYGASLDITDRKKAEITLRENKTEELKQEIAQRKNIEEQQQKRLKYEKAISECSKLLLESTTSEALKQSLEILQKTTSADRVFFYRNKDIRGELYLDPVMEVAKEGVEPIVESIEQKFKYSDLPWLYEKLSAFEKVHANIDELPEPERSILQDQQVKSILIIPFAIEDEWKGYIGFADTHQKRVWDDEEISLLTTASRIIAAFEKRKSIEQSLVEQRNYTDTILDSLPSIYLLMNEDLEFVQWNTYAEKFTGYTGDELNKKKAFDLIAPEEHEKLRTAIDNVRQKKGTGSELYLLTKSGEKIPFFWRGYFIELNNEEFFLCVGIDITQQKETQKALKEEKKFTEGIIESLPGIFYTVDTDGNYIRWNKNFEEYLGYTGEEISSMNPSDFFSERENKRIEEGIEEAFEQGENMLETKITTKDGNEIPYLLTANIIEQNGEKYLTGVGHDISEEVKAREKLRKNEELFRNLFLNAPAGIVMVDPENRVVNVNKSFENTFGFSEEELTGNDIDEFIVPPGERGKVPRMPLKKYASENFHREAKRLTKDGALVDVFIAAIPVYIDGEPIAGFGMYIDITEEKEYEKQIADALEEKRVMLKEIHHRVKNNLAVVSGLLQLQMYESDDPVIRETLQESERRIQTMALIHEKLYNSDNLGRISCDTYITDLLETIRNTIGADRDIKIITEIEPIELDINRAVPFALLVNEVVTNSFKHAFEGRSDNRIAVSITQKSNQVLAKIADNGKGLPADLIPEESDSLGINLIGNFAQQLDANWDLGSDDGTYITLRFDNSDPNSDSSLDQF